MIIVQNRDDSTGIVFNNGDHIDHDKVGLMQPTPKDAPLDEMRRKMKETGYIFVKNLIPRGDVLHVRERSVLHPKVALQESDFFKQLLLKNGRGRNVGTR
jgi:hypothetical protein